MNLCNMIFSEYRNHNLEKLTIKMLWSFRGIYFLSIYEENETFFYSNMKRVGRYITLFFYFDNT